MWQNQTWVFPSQTTSDLPLPERQWQLWMEVSQRKSHRLNSGWYYARSAVFPWRSGNMVYFNFTVFQFMGNTHCSDNLQIETNCRVAGYMRMLYSACRQQNGFASRKEEKKIAFLSFTSPVRLLKKLLFHMALQSYLYFRCHFIKKNSSEWTENCIWDVLNPSHYTNTKPVVVLFHISHKDSQDE